MTTALHRLADAAAITLGVWAWTTLLTTDEPAYRLFRRRGRHRRTAHPFGRRPAGRHLQQTRKIHA